jgi:hypothetical protein
MARRRVKAPEKDDFRTSKMVLKKLLFWAALKYNTETET